MFKLRTKPTQFTSGKTEETLCDITQRYLLSVENNNTHIIDVVITNKSLPETQQWKCRTDAKFRNLNIENINIFILSSKSKDYTNMSTLIEEHIYRAQTKNDLPNVIIVCYHKKRVCDDIIKLLDSCSRNSYLFNRNNHNIKIELSFDEPDANLGVTTEFLHKVKRFLSMDILSGILFITATPFDDFWDMLREHGIHKLLNINRNSILPFEDELTNYRQLNEHTFVLCENEADDPLSYCKYCITNGIISAEGRKIIFAPSKIKTSTHEDVAEYFKTLGYCAFIMNGKFKGFIYPTGDIESIESFNETHSITGELRESLAKWNELHPTMNLVITGYYVIERGITFNTTGFNFTHMIFTKYILSNLGKAVQIAGRGTGNKNYVNQMVIICPEEVKTQLEQRIKLILDICAIKPDYFNKTDFEPGESSIPIKLEIVDSTTLNRLHEIFVKKRRDKEVLHNLLIEAIEQSKIVLTDNNNDSPETKFNIRTRVLSRVGVYKLGDKIDVRRFKQFKLAHDTCSAMSQTGTKDDYSIDFAKDEYILGDFINPPNIAWITFKYE
jgi:hypothetical protein